MRFVYAFFLLLLPVMSVAEDAPLAQPERGTFLPVANGHMAIPFVQPQTAVPVQTGATIEFVSEGGLRIRELVWATGYVLGTRDGVVLLEVKSDTAVGLARALKRLEVRLRTKELPDPDVIALRLKHKDNEHGILLAPSLLSFKVEFEISPEQLDALRPGMQLSIGRDGESVDVRYVLFELLEQGGVQMTFAGRRSTALEAIRLAKAGALRIVTSKGPIPAQEKKCFIINRRGAERLQIRIPCT